MPMELHPHPEAIPHVDAFGTRARHYSSFNTLMMMILYARRLIRWEANLEPAAFASASDAIVGILRRIRFFLMSLL